MWTQRLLDAIREINARWWQAMPTLYLLICLPVAAHASIATNPESADVVLHITDIGIQQWFAEYSSGANFATTLQGHTPNRVFPTLCQTQGCAAQILLVMPSNEDLDSLSPEQLQAQLATVLRTKLAEAGANGGREFEIQLIQNIDVQGYTDPAQQQRVRKFGQAAYAAVGDAHQTLGERGHSVYTDATVGSNGTVMLTESIKSWSRYLQAVDLIDGRASMEATLATIRAIRKLTGSNGVRIFNAMGDWPAPDRLLAAVFGATATLARLAVPSFEIVSLPGRLPSHSLGSGPKPSIGNSDVVAEILVREPDTAAYFIERLDLEKLPAGLDRRYFGKLVVGVGHVAAMNGRDFQDSPFFVSRLLPLSSGGFVLSGGVQVFYADLRRKDIAADRPRNAKELRRLIELAKPEDRWAIATKSLIDLQRLQPAPGSADARTRDESQSYLIHQAPALVAQARATERATAVQGFMFWIDAHGLATDSTTGLRVESQITRDTLQAGYAAHAHAYQAWSQRDSTPATPGRAKGGHGSRLLLVPRADAELFAENVVTLAKALRDLPSGQLLKAHPLGAKLLAYDEKLLKALELLIVVSKSLDAVEKDIAEIREGRFTVWRSSTIELLGKKVFTDALTGLLNFALSNGAGSPGFRSVPTFGSVELARALSRQIEDGRVDIATITLYLDAFNKLAWSVLGVVRCAGNLQCAASYEKIGDQSAKTARRLLLPAMTHWVGRRDHQYREVVEQWRTLIRRQYASGTTILDMEAVYGIDTLDALGLNARERAQYNQEAATLRDARQHVHSGQSLDLPLETGELPAPDDDDDLLPQSSFNALLPPWCLPLESCLDFNTAGSDDCPPEECMKPAMAKKDDPCPNPEDCEPPAGGVLIAPKDAGERADLRAIRKRILKHARDANPQPGD